MDKATLHALIRITMLVLDAGNRQLQLLHSAMPENTKDIAAINQQQEQLLESLKILVTAYVADDELLATMWEKGLFDIGLQDLLSFLKISLPNNY